MRPASDQFSSFFDDFLIGVLVFFGAGNPGRARWRLGRGELGIYIYIYIYIYIHTYVYKK